MRTGHVIWFGADFKDGHVTVVHPVRSAETPGYWDSFREEHVTKFRLKRDPRLARIVCWVRGATFPFRIWNQCTGWRKRSIENRKTRSRSGGLPWRAHEGKKKEVCEVGHSPKGLGLGTEG